jgi:hypothetical protein
MTKTSDTIEDLQPNNIDRVSVRLFFKDSEEQYKFLDWLHDSGQEFQWLDNWESQFQSPLTNKEKLIDIYSNFINYIDDRTEYGEISREGIRTLLSLMHDKIRKVQQENE